MRHFITIIIFGFVFIATSVIAQKVVIVESDYDGWTNSGIDISYGQSVIIFAHGLANTDGGNAEHFHNPHHWGGPAGCAFKAGLADPSWNFLADNLAQMALVGKIGSSDPFFIGDMAKFIASTSGTLYLGYNDQHGSFGANIGQFVCFILTASNLSKISSGSIENYDFNLNQNYPNPFNLKTNIEYSLNKTGKTKLTIFNSLGQKIRTLVDEIQQPGNYTITWDGTDINGNTVSTGQYFYQVIQDNEKVTKRAILLK